jgi:transcriptional regulator with XRE-family HTH domain
MIVGCWSFAEREEEMSETHRQYIGRRVKRFRKISTLSQKEFAKKAGIPLAEYIRIENGEVEIRVKRYARLRDAAGIKLLTADTYKPSVSQLFGKNINPQQQKLLQGLLKMEEDAAKDGVYWVDFLREFFPSMAEIIQRMIREEIYQKNMSRA